MVTSTENGGLLSAAAILFGATLMAGTLPIYFFNFLFKKFGKSNRISSNGTKKRWSHFVKTVCVKEKIVHFLSQIGGGVLLYTALIHMLPNIRKNYTDYLKNLNASENSTERPGQHESGHGHTHDLPIVDLFSCVGFFGIFFIEELIRIFLLMKHPNYRHGTRKESAKARRPLPRCLSQHFLAAPHFLQSRKQCYPQTSHKNYNLDCKAGPTKQEIASNECQPIMSKKVTRYDSCGQSMNGLSNLVALDNSFDRERTLNLESLGSEDTSLWARILDGLFLIITLACHSILDGVAIGVQSRANTWAVLGFILLHKVLLAFCLSMQIYERSFQTMHDEDHITNEPLKRAKLILWLFSGLFAVMAPIGILIVIALGSSPSEAHKQLHVILAGAISAGGLLYLVFLEIIDKGNSRNFISGWAQWIALSVGFVLMPLVSMCFHQNVVGH